MKRHPNPQLLAEVLAGMAELRFAVDTTRIPVAHPGDVTPTTLATVKDAAECPAKNKPIS